MARELLRFRVTNAAWAAGSFDAKTLKFSNNPKNPKVFEGGEHEIDATEHPLLKLAILDAIAADAGVELILKKKE